MFSPTSIAKTSSDNHKRKYKDAWRKLLDIKQDIYNTKLRRFIQCIFILLIIVIIIYILLCYKHIITGATFNSSSPLHQDINTNDANINNNNITMDKKEKIIIPNNSNNVSSIDKILVDSNSTNDKDKEQEEDIESNDNNNDNDIVNGINPKNISQPDIQKFIDNWGKEKEPAKDDKTSKKNNKSLLLKNHTLHQNMWSRSNLSDKPRLSLSSSQLNDISISSLVWDFGSCGCTGWGIETVNIIKPLSERIDNIKLITDYDCWCPGYSEETQVKNIYIYKYMDIYIIYMI